jgi:hypothetical protein
MLTSAVGRVPRARLSVAGTIVPANQYWWPAVVRTEEFEDKRIDGERRNRRGYERLPALSIRYWRLGPPCAAVVARRDTSDWFDCELDS